MKVTPAMFAALCCCLACGAQKTAQKEQRVTRDELGNSWPFTLSEGTLTCPGGQEVVFTANGQTYPINAVAASSKKYAEIDAIWAADPLAPGTRKDIGPLMARGAKLCE